jgi:hypothetical protein
VKKRKKKHKAKPSGNSNLPTQQPPSQPQQQKEIAEITTPLTSTLPLQPKPASQHGPTLLLKIIFRSSWKNALLFLSIAANVVQIWGQPWPVPPVFRSGPISSGSPLDIPFIVENRSAFFWIRRPRLKCRVLSLHTQDNRIDIGGGPGTLMSINDAPSADIKPGGTAPAKCAASSFNFPGTKLRDGKITFLIEYDSVLPWRGSTETESEVFILDTKLVPPQWIEGEPLR